MPRGCILRAAVVAVLAQVTATQAAPRADLLGFAADDHLAAFGRIAGDSRHFGTMFVPMPQAEEIRP
jgi:hypothetical protein